MHHRELSFSQFKLLSQLVYDVYELHSDDKEVIYSTAPNGIIGISAVLEGRSWILSGNDWQPTPVISIYGLVNKPDVIRMSKGFREIAIGFKPYFLQLLLKNSMSDVAGTMNVDAFDFFKRDALKTLYDQLYTGKSDFEVLAAIELFLYKHVNSSKEDKRLEYAVDLVYGKQVRNVEALSHAVNLSSTSLRQLFKDGVGQSPKEVLKILRLNQVLKHAPGSFNSLTELSYSSGYFDQSHFIHDFKTAFGITPRQYFQNKALTFDFYNFGRWNGNIFEKK